MQQTLNRTREFAKSIAEQRKTYLIKDLNLLTKNINEQKLVFISTLSFFLIEEQLAILLADQPTFRQAQTQLQTLFVEKVTAHLLDTCRFGYTPRDILVIKKTLHYCAVVCRLKHALDLEGMYLGSSLGAD